MIDESIREILTNLNGKYRFNDLLTLMEESGITFYNRGLYNALGLTTPEAIYLDMNMMMRLDDRLMFFVILHEMAHYKRIQKKGGLNWLLGQLSISNFDDFSNALFEEEILADRYACRMFYRLNRDIYQWKHTQQLNLKSHQDIYREAMGTAYYNRIQNDENKYRLLIETFIK